MTLRARSFIAAVALLAFTLAGSNAFGQTRTLYDRLGGYGAISAVVDDFVKNVAADKRINKFFANANIDRLKARLVEQICQGTGGSCVYTGRDMKSVHAGMGIRGRLRCAGAGPRQEPQQVQSAGEGTKAIGCGPGAHEEGHRHALTAPVRSPPRKRGSSLQLWIPKHKRVHARP